MWPNTREDQEKAGEELFFAGEEVYNPESSTGGTWTRHIVCHLFSRSWRRIKSYLSNPFPGYPPLSLGYVAALKPGNWDIEIIDENFETAYFRPCNFVGITVFTVMANCANQLADIFRERIIPMVMGGIHASMMRD